MVGNKRGWGSGGEREVNMLPPHPPSQFTLGLLCLLIFLAYSHHGYSYQWLFIVMSNWRVESITVSCQILGGVIFSLQTTSIFAWGLQFIQRTLPKVFGRSHAQIEAVWNTKLKPAKIRHKTVMLWALQLLPIIIPLQCPYTVYAIHSGFHYPWGSHLYNSQ